MTLKTKIQHTCNTTGGKKKVLKNAPFLAVDDIPKKKFQFLGEGYYFWDDNVEMANIWGKFHCNDKYYVVEMDLEFSSNDCFDIVGNRQHQKLIFKTFDELRKRGYDKKEWQLSNILNLLKKLSKKDKNAFPYSMIRAIDYMPRKEYNKLKLHFVQNNNHYTIVNPKMVICILNKNILPLHSKRLVS